MHENCSKLCSSILTFVSQYPVLQNVNFFAGRHSFFRKMKINMADRKKHMRPVPTKWETSRKISFPSYNLIHVALTLSFKMIYYMSWLLPYLGSKNYFFLVKFLCFLLIFNMFNKPYLLLFPGDLSLILWEQVSYVLSKVVKNISFQSKTLLVILNIFWRQKIVKTVWPVRVKSSVLVFV